MTNVATLMIGQQLKSGWTIRALKPTLPAATGGCFSYCFLATNADGAEAFVKILDIKLDETLDEPLVDLQIRVRFGGEQVSSVALAVEAHRSGLALGHRDASAHVPKGV
jgi:hypothetical protein